MNTICTSKFELKQFNVIMITEKHLQMRSEKSLNGRGGELSLIITLHLWLQLKA